MFLKKDSSASIHDINIQFLATGMYKVNSELLRPLVSIIFTQNESHPYNLRLNSQFCRLLRSVFHGSENISYLGPVIWVIPSDS